MQNVRIFVAVLAACAILPAFAREDEHGAATPHAAKVPRAAQVVVGKSLSLKLAGLHCEGCAMGVRSKLLQVPGVSTATVSAKTQSATVRLAKGAKRPTDAVLKAAVQSAGYTCVGVR